MKIKSVYIHSFRGIPKELTVDFTDKKGKPISTVIYGDNGSGKSSIVDAIEYNLQGRISRDPLIITSESRTPISYCYSPIIGANTKVVLEDNSTHERGIDVRFNGVKTEFQYDNKYILKEFALTPITLRRGDIISFGVIPKDKRQVLFFSFLYQYYTKIEDAVKNSIHWEGDQYIKSLTDSYVQLKQKRKEKIDELAKLIDVPVNHIPFGERQKFESFVNAQLKIKGFNHKGSKLVAKYFRSGRKEMAVKEIKEGVIRLIQEIKEVKTTTEKALNPNVYGVTVQERRESNAKFINKASEFLSESFIKISNLDFVRSIQLELGSYTSASLEITVVLKNGKVSTPNQLFSEANYDLMVLLLYISLIRAGAESGQAKLMILDDVLQSVDSVIRAKFIDYILQVCKDWQLIITCHDALWMNQLRYLYQKNGMPFKEFKLMNWEFEKGPTLLEVKGGGQDNTLKEAIATNNKQIIASQAGLFMEFICQKLSTSLPISVKRTPDDKYTIGDLWPGIISVFKGVAEMKAFLDELNREVMARNMIGCHSNEWAQGMSDCEVLSFAKRVQEFYERAYCPECNTWITTRTCSGKYIAECRCRSLQYRKE